MSSVTFRCLTNPLYVGRGGSDMARGKCTVLEKLENRCNQFA